MITIPWQQTASLIHVKSAISKYVHNQFYKNWTEVIVDLHKLFLLGIFSYFFFLIYSPYLNIPFLLFIIKFPFTLDTP